MNSDRDWSSLGVLAIHGISNLLNCIDHVRFRSVCSNWRALTNPRQKTPLVILINLDQEKHIKALSFFDISRKEIIPLGDFVALHQSFYCGSGFGWIFLSKIVNYRVTGGRGNWQRLRITLLNPFTGRVVRLPLLDRAPGGRVLMSDPAPHVEAFPCVQLLYYMVENGQVSNVYDWLRMRDKKWKRRHFDEHHHLSDLIVFDGSFYAIEQQRRVVYEFCPLNPFRVFHFDFMTRNLQSTIPKELRFFSAARGPCLYVVCASHTPHTYCVFEVYVVFDDFFVIGGEVYDYKMFLRISPDLMVHRIQGDVSSEAGNVNPTGLFESLQLFWNNPCQPWEAAGWITPDMRDYEDEDQPTVQKRVIREHGERLEASKFRFARDGSVAYDRDVIGPGPFLEPEIVSSRALVGTYLDHIFDA